MTGEPIMNAITKRVNIQLDSLLVRWNVCSIDGNTGPIIPVSSDPMNTPIKNSAKIRLRVFLSKVFPVILIHFVFFLNVVHHKVKITEINYIFCGILIHCFGFGGFPIIIYIVV